MMSELEKFAFIYLPIIVVVVAGVATLIFNKLVPPSNKKSKAAF